jgi:calcium-translocating P-type ATPase
MSHWYQKDAEKVLKEFSVSNTGLNPEEVEKRLAQYGPNQLPDKGKVTLLQVVFRQFLSPLIYVLIIAAAISLVLQEYADAIFILIVLFVNALIGSVQEWKAESSARALKDMVKVQVQAIRSGKRKSIPAEELVPGDIVLLESGNKVPADMRLIESNSLMAEEALLTGESVAIEKNTETIVKEVSTPGDQTNMVFAGTIITSGRGKGVVTATAENTEIGKIATDLEDTSVSKIPLIARMESFSKNISFVILGACALIGFGAYLADFEMQEIFFFMVAIAVSAIPEGLPISMTVALSTGTSRMSKRHVITRKLAAVEGLGSCTMISTDKTGTLTVDQQTVKKILLHDGTTYEITGQGYNGIGEVSSNDGLVTFDNDSSLANFVKAVVTCNEATLTEKSGEWEHQGDAVDVALLALAYKAGVDPSTILKTVSIEKEIPFEPARKYAAVYYRYEGDLYFAIKGAAEVVLEGAEGDHSDIASFADELAAEGYRYIAAGGGKVDRILSEDELPAYNLLGFVAFIDPPRKEVKGAIDEAHQAGVDVCMITGDHPATALSIARELHIAKYEHELITGAELAKAENQEAFYQLVKGKRVFARVSPQQKQAIVEAQQNSGHFVAVTGDGVNDAPALKTANIGVAMGYGTDVTKEVSSIIITDNNFASIVAGIQEGRITYSNIRKIIYLLISTGAAELLMITMALIFGTPLPFLPAQILWLNLVTNGIQDKVLAFEKGEPQIMEEPPRSPKEKIFNKEMISQVVTSAVIMATIAFVLWYHLLYNLNYSEFEARNISLLLMVLFQNFHVLNCRSEYKSLFKIPLSNNRWLFVGIIGAQLIHILAMYFPPMQELLNIAPVSLEDWIKLFFTAGLIFVGMEIFKLFRRERKARNPVEE